MNGTPIVDIKPYLAYTDSHPEAVCGFADEVLEKALAVKITPELLDRVPPFQRAPLLALLRQDPRPSYQKDPARVYGMSFAGLEVKFTVTGDVLRVIDIGVSDLS